MESSRGSDADPPPPPHRPALPGLLHVLRMLRVLSEAGQLRRLARFAGLHSKTGGASPEALHHLAVSLLRFLRLLPATGQGWSWSEVRYEVRALKKAESMPLCSRPA